MSEVFVQFETVVSGPNGSRFTPRACGRARADGLWESWIEFEPASHADGPLHTSRESVQPNRDDLMYWAQGLTQTYLEGALNRAVSLGIPRGSSVVPTHDLDDVPSPSLSTTTPAGPRAVLNPFEVWEQGEHILVRQLAALNSARLRDVAVGYGFAARQTIINDTSDSLIATIVNGVRTRRAAM